VKWGGTGTPEEILFKGERILRKGTEGTYCCGFTLAVVMRAAAQLHLLDDKTVEQMKTFHMQWYGAVKDEEIQVWQCVYAMERLGIGHRVSADEAKAGDFCQFYRERNGHSVVFLHWVEKDGKRIGLTYRSSQESTKGIGDKTEYFSDSGVTMQDEKITKVIRDRMYFGRLNAAPAGESK
jgi:hypothetical protein